MGPSVQSDASVVRRGTGFLVWTIYWLPGVWDVRGSFPRFLHVVFYICQQSSVIILPSSLLLKDFPAFVFVTLFFSSLYVLHLILIPPSALVTPSALFPQDGNVRFDED